MGQEVFLYVQRQYTDLYLCCRAGRAAAQTLTATLTDHLYVSVTDLVLPDYVDEQGKRAKADVFALNREDFDDLVQGFREDHGWVGYDTPLC